MCVALGLSVTYRLLLLTDDPLISVPFSRHLSMSGFEVDCADDLGVAAEKMSAQAPHGIIVLAGGTPTEDAHSLQVVRTLRVSYPAVPIIALSRKRLPLFTRELLERGANFVMLAPWSPREVGQKCAGLLSRDRAQRAS